MLEFKSMYMFSRQEQLLNNFAAIAEFIESCLVTQNRMNRKALQI